MLPIPAAVAIVGGIALILIKVLASETQKEPSEFDEKDIITTHHKFFKPNEETKAKIHTTRTINKLIQELKKFKVGKSGSPSERNAQHTKFKKMYIVVESDDKHFIDKLEKVYNEKYITNSKNVNCKIGSAGDMTDKNSRYFLYFVAV